MATTTTTGARSAPAAGLRLSPKVRRLLREHGLQPGDVEGTGRAGRITPGDVERRVGGRRGGTRPGRRPDRGSGPVLASPLARRLLREAGIAPADVAGTGPGHSVTRADATRAIRRARTATPSDRATATVEVDLTRLLHATAAARHEVSRTRGVDLPPLAAIAHATCRSLRRHPELNGAGPDDPGPHRDVDLRVVADDAAVTPTIACAQDLTVAALAERLARPAADGDGGSTFTIGEGEPRATATDRTAALHVGTPAQRPVALADEFGGDTTATRWRAPLRLTYDPDRVDGPTARAFLTDLARELETVDLLAGVA